MSRPRITTIVAAVTAAAALGAAGPAHASFSGRPGVLAVQQYSSFTDTEDNGDFDETFGLRLFATPIARAHSVVGCSGTDGTYDDEVGLCPTSTPSFNPGGSRIVFAAVATGPDGTAMNGTQACTQVTRCANEVVLAGADGSDPQAIPLPSLSGILAPHFTATGEIVLSASPAPGAARQLFEFDPAAPAPAPVTQLTQVAGAATQPAPCGDGSILYTARGGISQWRPGRAIRQITHGGTAADCSQDSRSIVFVRAGRLYTQLIGGKGLRPLGPREPILGTPAYSPAGGRIAVIAGNGRCTGKDCGGPDCPVTFHLLEQIGLGGKLLSSQRIGSDGCDEPGADPDIENGVSWQAL